MPLNVTDWFEYPSNFSNGSSVDGLGSFVQYSSYIVNDWMASGILLLIWLSAFSISLIAGSRKALMTASFICFPFAVYLSQLDMISPIIVFVIIALGILGALGSKEPSSY